MLIINQMWTSAKSIVDVTQLQLTVWTRRDHFSAYVKTDTREMEDFVWVSEV